MKQNLILLILLVSNISFGQFTYQGKIVDANTNQTIVVANVRIKDTNKGAITDQQGEFKISKGCIYYTKANHLNGSILELMRYRM